MAFILGSEKLIVIGLVSKIPNLDLIIPVIALFPIEIE
jgi:hypothetical protein